MKTEEYSNRLTEKGLKVTPQRIAILEAVNTLNNHPTAENVIDYIRKNHPNVAIATVYKILEALVSCGLIKRVKTDRDIMRYDAVTNNHHHLYCIDSDRIEDYYDEDLDGLIVSYFKKRKITNFKIEDWKLSINGKFVSGK